MDFKWKYEQVKAALFLLNSRGHTNINTNHFKPFESVPVAFIPLQLAGKGLIHRQLHNMYTTFGPHALSSLFNVLSGKTNSLTIPSAYFPFK